MAAIDPRPWQWSSIFFPSAGRSWSPHLGHPPRCAQDKGQQPQRWVRAPQWLAALLLPHPRRAHASHRSNPRAPPTLCRCRPPLTLQPRRPRPRFAAPPAALGRSPPAKSLLPCTAHRSAPLQPLSRSRPALTGCATTPPERSPSSEPLSPAPRRRSPHPARSCFPLLLHQRLALHSSTSRRRPAHRSYRAALPLPMLSAATRRAFPRLDLPPPASPPSPSFPLPSLSSFPSLSPFSYSPFL